MRDDEKPIFEIDNDSNSIDPDETPIRDRKVVTQPYDIAVQSLIEQVLNDTIFLRPLSDRPKFQRNYVWSDDLASRLIESVLLNVPIPPCYLSQNDEFELDVIDGQQRIYSLFRYVQNQFPLKNLEVFKELNDIRFHELDSRKQRQLKTFTLRCVLITNESHPEIKFDVFERLNTNTVPLNAQELRNCIYRGRLNELLGEISLDPTWLKAIGRKTPDKRLRDEELILRFFAFHFEGVNKYRTPLKHWLNDVAKAGRTFSAKRISDSRAVWDQALGTSIIWFDKDVFRRPGGRAINRALFDLVMSTAKKISVEDAPPLKKRALQLFNKLLEVEEFDDLIGRAVDHKSRTLRRFALWSEKVEKPLLDS